MSATHREKELPDRGRSSGLHRRVRAFEDFEQLFAQWNGSFAQLTRGSFEGKIQVVSGAGLRLFRVETNQSLLTRGSDSAPLMTFIPITPRNEGTVWQGRRLSQGDIIVKQPEVAYNNRTMRDTTITALLVPTERFRDASRVLTGNDLLEQMAPWDAVRPRAEALERFHAALDLLLSAAVAEPQLMAGERGVDIANSMLRLLVDAIAQPQKSEAVPAAWRSSRLVQRATDLMHAHLDGSLSALALCAELGVSDRTLRRVFLETYGMGPLAYFRVLRLHAVRAALRNARGSNRSVAEIARNGGFRRMGAFAAEYRRQFGELPSKTLEHAFTAPLYATGSAPSAGLRDAGVPVTANRNRSLPDRLG